MWDTKQVYEAGEPTSPAHLHLDPVAPSFTDLLTGFDTDASFRGSKFVLHPQNPIVEQDLPLLRSAVCVGHNDGASFVLLERNYFEISASTLLRGNWHLLNSGNSSTGSPSLSKVISKLEATELARKNPSGESGTDGSAVPADRMAILLLRLLSNDLMHIHMLQGLQNTFIQPYASINDDMPGLFERIGVDARALEELPSRLKNPVIRKLKTLDGNRLPKADQYRSLCDHAAYLRREALAGRANHTTIFGSWIRADNVSLTPQIHEPKLKSLVSPLLS